MKYLFVLLLFISCSTLKKNVQTEKQTAVTNTSSSTEVKNNSAIDSLTWKKFLSGSVLVLDSDYKKITAETSIGWVVQNEDTLQGYGIVIPAGTVATITQRTITETGNKKSTSQVNTQRTDSTHLKQAISTEEKQSTNKATAVSSLQVNKQVTRTGLTWWYYVVIVCIVAFNIYTHRIEIKSFAHRLFKL